MCYNNQASAQLFTGMGSGDMRRVKMVSGERRAQNVVKKLTVPQVLHIM